MYAGKPFAPKDELLPEGGDLVVPLVDLEAVFGADWFLLWDDYTWNPNPLHMEHESMFDVHAASFGFGAAVNCILDLVNVDETSVQNDNAGLHRGKDPGVGAFTSYHNRQAMATQPIEPGHELFASYGLEWFRSRRHSLPPIPLLNDLKRGNDLLKKFATLQTHFSNPSMRNDLIDTFLWNNPFQSTSRVLFGLPKTHEELERAINTSLKQVHRQHHTRSLEWLDEHGVCGDHLQPGNSTLPQAGRGAFARRRLTNGSVVAPLPLIHVESKRFVLKHTSPPIPPLSASHQLLYNYCFGHKETTLLLCPYGTLTSLVNHNQTLANVQVRWSTRQEGQTSWFNYTPSQVLERKSAGLSMELVAMRDIDEGEEIFLDYGDDWEDTWQRHVQHWRPARNGHDYVSAPQLQESEMQIRTVFEQLQDPYPVNVELRCYRFFTKPRQLWMNIWQNKSLATYIHQEALEREPCDVLRRETDNAGNVWYQALLHEGDERVRMRKVPREAIVFVDRPHTSDMHLPNAFRHYMGIPDHLLPDKWRTIRPKERMPRRTQATSPVPVD